MLASLLALAAAAPDPCLAEGAHIAWRGDFGPELLECLARAPGPRIATLVIDSGGGDVESGLQVFERGIRFGVVEVRGLCASSCANYILPLAERVEIGPGAHVLLHGGVRSTGLPPREALEKQLQRDFPQIEPQALRRAAAEFAATFATLAAREEAFARTTGVCDAWLDPEQALQQSRVEFVEPTAAAAAACLHIPVTSQSPPQASRTYKVKGRKVLRWDGP